MVQKNQGLSEPACRCALAGTSEPSITNSPSRRFLSQSHNQLKQAAAANSFCAFHLACPPHLAAHAWPGSLIKCLAGSLDCNIHILNTCSAWGQRYIGSTVRRTICRYFMLQGDAIIGVMHGNAVHTSPGLLSVFCTRRRGHFLHMEHVRADLPWALAALHCT